MLQHTSIDRVAIPPVLRAAAGWQTMAELELTANAAVADLRARRTARAEDLGGIDALAVRIDDRLRTDAPEYLDDPHFSPRRKERIVQSLHRFNQGVFAYRRFYRVLRPLIRQVLAERGGPVRILELASGSGEFSFVLADLARREKIAVQVTGSDYFSEHVENGNRKAEARGSSVRFLQVNAFDMSALEAGAWDIVFIAQSIHHFSPGQVAMMVAQATRVATVGFVGIDGRRSLELFPFVPAVGVLMGSGDFVHDAIVTLRKFYTDSELELIARIAVPDGFVSVRPELPGYSVLMATA
jgi:SAM-dependent methyltransferase